MVLFFQGDITVKKMYCRKCGKEISESVLFCPGCGSRVADVAGRLKLPESYEIYEELGAGGGGTVFKAYHKNLRKTVVIKKIHEGTGDEEQQRTEVDVLKNLHHQYLPQVFDYFTAGGTGYTVMDYIEGESFQQLLDRGVKFKEKQILKYAGQIAEALDYLHSRKLPIIHGDIKPDNIMRTPEDNICLIDFNISGITHNGKAQTFGYTAGYSAPEQYDAFVRIRSMMDRRGLDGGGRTFDQGSDFELSEGITIDKRSDIYSLGATLYRMYCGKKYDPDSDTVLKGNVSEGFVYILNRSLQADPSKRFQDAGELKKVLANLHKRNGAYRRLVVVQTLLQLFLVGSGIVGAGLIVSGRDVLEREKQDQYSAYISELEDYRIAGNDTAFEAVFEEAEGFYPERIESYYQKALFLYQKHEYEDDIKFIEGSVMPNGSLYAQEGIADIYFILGNCYFELADYITAAEHFSTAIYHNDANPEYYVDQAIAYARVGDIDSAERALENAQGKGVSDDMVYLVNGEICYAKGDYAEAEKILKECISETDDDYVSFRAYMRCSQSIDGQKPVISIAESDGDETVKFRELTDRCTGVLNEAINNLPVDYHMFLMQQLTAEYIDAYDKLSDENYALAAIEIMKKMDANGWADYTLYDNMVNIYHRIGMYDDEEALLSDMDKTYPNDYRIKVKCALLEFQRQRDKEQNDRDFSYFEELYDEALRLYETSDSREGSEQEIGLLKQAYQELVDSNWITD